MIGVTNTFGACVYISTKHGVVFRFTLTRDKSADMVAEVHRAKPGTKHPSDHAGPIIASKDLKIRHGDDSIPLTIVVPLTESQVQPRRTRCIFQTNNLGPDIIGPSSHS